jgi:soluble lytic murein transglycosylase
LVESYPDGDMWVDAAFSLAMLARKRGEHGAALSALERLVSAGRDERTEGAEGRAQYWRARTLHDLGRKSEAIDGYEQLVRSSLLGSYYSQQALARLAELAPKKAATLVATAMVEGPLGSPRFSYRAEMAEPAFDAALELLRVGEIDLAMQELAWLGATRSNAEPELAWLAAAVLDAAGAHAEASRVARPRVRALPSTADASRARELLRIAYPHAFSPVLEHAAAEAAVPASLLRAVAREESAFDPKAVSPARAYGLVQLIVPTARTYAKPLGLPSHPSALKQPEVNLRIGSRLLRSLLDRYDGLAALVPAAYNAGPGAADRWLAGARGQALDEFIEAIPYSETRRYTRRVLQSYGMYAWLDEGKLPHLPARLPQ